MLYIKANHLTDGLYNIKDGEIFKYKAKGGTVRTYEIGNIVRCFECAKWLESNGICMWDKGTSLLTKADDFCSYGKYKEELDD